MEYLTQQLLRTKYIHTYGAKYLTNEVNAVCFVVYRTESEDQFGDTTYNIKIITLYKTEEDVDYPEEVVITTAGSSAQCGIYLEVGVEYLLDFYRYAINTW